MKRPFMLIPQSEFERVRECQGEKLAVFRAVADMCRLNALTAVKIAGSGHLGSSLSSMELFTYLYYGVISPNPAALKDPCRHVFFSSKGHDVPGQYAVLHSLGIISTEQFLRLRRLGGLDGHPDVGIPGIEANSGSLGMGISKGKGMVKAKQLNKNDGHVFVLTGDGEFQEGQNFEALQSAIPQSIRRLTVIMDHNKVQSDKKIEDIVPLGSLREKIKQFGWKVMEIDGNNLQEISSAIAISLNMTDRPAFIIAHTIKGKGVSFMEHPQAMFESGGLYPYHAGAPGDEKYYLAFNELHKKVNKQFERLLLGGLQFVPVDPEALSPHIHLNELGEPVSQAAPPNSSLKAGAEYVVEAYGQALAELGEEVPEMVVLDADLSADCRLRSFENRFPDRFIECGIAEQDMVSMAGGMARNGLLPVVNSFASFLASRANEQIYNNFTESSKIVYAFHYAGLIPAGPGKSHQSIRDISLVRALPGIIIIQPANPAETREAIRYCVLQADATCVLRMNISPSPRKIDMPEGWRFVPGQGNTLVEGKDAAIIAYGPVMLNEALICAEILAETGNTSIKVINMPWLNRVDLEWLKLTLGPVKKVFTIDDHAIAGGFGDFLLSEMYNAGMLRQRELMRFGIEGMPACGTPQEALRFHRLDGASLAKRIQSHLSA